MTANQIAYQANIEIGRHNRATESELNRHNLVQEDLDAQGLKIQDEKNKITQDYQTRQNEIQDRYNQEYLAWQKASTKGKLEVENRLANIQEEKNQIQSEYNVMMRDIQERSNMLRDKELQESQRHNASMESIDRTYKTNWFAIETRKAEYQSTYYRELISEQRAANNIQAMRNANDLRVGLLNNSVTRYRADLDYLLLPYDQQMKEAYANKARRESDLLPWHYGNESLNTLSNVVKSGASVIVPFFGD